MREKLKTQYAFSDYQVAQLEFVCKTLAAELSKLLIIGLFFLDRFPIYVVSILLLAFLRVSTGGLHCKKYLSCLLVSFLYVFLCIQILPLIYVNKLFQMILLFLCLLINYYLGPVLSDVHLPLSSKRIKGVKIQAFIIIFFVLIVTYILPENALITSCFWIVVLHTLQLLMAKIRKKGGVILEIFKKTDQARTY